METIKDSKEIDPKEVEKLQNFLQKALLSKYLTPFLSNGVYRVKDLQEYVKEEFLLSINMSQPERNRFWKNVERSRNPLWKLKQKFRKAENPNSTIYAEIGQFSTVPVSGAILISHQEIVELGIVGKGNFGEVSRGMWHYNHNMAPKPVAVKIVSTVTEEDRNQVMREAEVWNKLEHENIVRLYGITVTQPYKLIMELAPKGSLDKYLRSKVNQLSIERMWQYSGQIARGMEYLHSKRIIHRDLACRNVLLMNDQQVKISDFGMTRFLPNEEDLMQTFTPQKVPYAWTAIEVLESGQYSNANDVWSFAVTLWEIFSYGTKPWKDLTMQLVTAQLQLDRRLEQPFICSEDIFSLMSRCWDREPKERPTFTDIKTQLEKMKPQIALAKMDSPSNLDEDQCVPYRKDDFINIIEKKLGDYWIGQSQANLKAGYVLSSDMETDAKKIHLFQNSKSRRKRRIVPPTTSVTQDDFTQFRKKNFDTNSDADPVYDAPREIQQANYDKMPPTSDTGDFIYEDAKNILSQSSKESRYLSVFLADRTETTDSIAYTTMNPGGLFGDKKINNQQEESRVFEGNGSDFDSDDSPYHEIGGSFDAYECHQRQTEKDSDGYDVPSGIDTLQLRKIGGDLRPKTAFYDDTINSDSALTPEQLTKRNRASLRFEQTEMALNLPRKNNYENSPSHTKPIPLPKPNKLKLYHIHNNDVKMLKKHSKPINESILTAEFPEIPENEISVILEMSLGNLTEARKDAKFRIFREHMQEENPMLQSVFCYDVFQKANFDFEKAKKVIVERYSKGDDPCYEFLS